MTIEMSPQLATPKQVCYALGICHSTLYRWIEQGIFPKPMSLSPRRRAWLWSDVHEHLMVKRDEAAA